MSRIALLLALIAGCQSLPKPDPTILLPATFESLFATCLSGDGALNIQVRESGQSLVSGDFEWIATIDEGWKGDFLNPIGRPLVRVSFERESGKVRVQGKLADRAPIIETDDDGYLIVDGFFIAVRASEVACLMNYRLPRALRPFLASHSQSESSHLMEFNDDKRFVRVEVARDRDKVKRICSNISWDVMLGLSSRELDICFEFHQGRIGRLSGLGEHDVRWVDIDG